jgi:hypothetical protein
MPIRLLLSDRYVGLSIFIQFNKSCILTADGKQLKALILSFGMLSGTSEPWKQLNSTMLKSSCSATKNKQSSSAASMIENLLQAQQTIDGLNSPYQTEDL